MAENDAVPAKRGRKPKDPNAPPKEKKMATGHKVYLVDGNKFDEFVASLTQYESKDYALPAANAIAEEAEKNGTLGNLKLVIFEEIGRMQPVVKVAPNFTSSRTIVRKEKTVAPEAPQTSDVTSPTETAPTTESTHSEPRRRRN